jgi:hypothetical protein
MKRILLLLALASTPFLSACSKDGECDTCSSDSDCKEPLVCSRFQDETTMRCASGVGATSCRVR